MTNGVAILSPASCSDRGHYLGASELELEEWTSFHTCHDGRFRPLSPARRRFEGSLRSSRPLPPYSLAARHKAAVAFILELEIPCEKTTQSALQFP